MRTFISKHHNNNMLYCNHTDQQAKEEIITYYDTVKIYFDEMKWKFYRSIYRVL